MPHVAQFVLVARVKDLTDKFRPFVIFGAKMEGREPDPGERVALLNVVSTDSYFPVFIDSGTSIADVEAALAKQDTQLNVDAKRALRQYIS